MAAVLAFLAPLTMSMLIAKHQEERLSRAQRYGTERIKKRMLDALQW
jgi:hypothetical protein